jgi:predicted regulator of Ras-like GTPase activity (Roadblock/LC7/MglB family)
MARTPTTRTLENRVRAELRKLRGKVFGVQGSLVATNDGFLVAHDVPGLEPTEIAALAATTRALASRSTLASGRGQFREALARGTDGYLAVFDAGGSAVVAVVGSSELNVAMLHYHARDVVERIGAFSAELGNWSAAASAAASAKASPPVAPAGEVAPGARPARGAAPSQPAQPDRPPPLPRRRTAATPRRTAD